MTSGLKGIADNLVGAWQVMLGRPEGLDRIDTSIEGFWRSFAAIILLAPFAVVSLASQLSLDVDPPAATQSPGSGSYGWNSVALLVDWITFPAIFALLAPAFGLGARYVPFIVARNWASVVIAAIVSIFHALHLAGVIPPVAMPFVLLVALAVALRFSYLVTRIALAVSMAMAIPIVILDLLISLTVWSAFARLT